MKYTLITTFLLLLSVSGTLSAQNAVSEREAMTVAPSVHIIRGLNVCLGAVSLGAIIQNQL